MHLVNSCSPQIASSISTHIVTVHTQSVELLTGAVRKMSEHLYNFHQSWIERFFKAANSWPNLQVYTIQITQVCHVKTGIVRATHLHHDFSGIETGHTRHLLKQPSALISTVQPLLFFLNISGAIYFLVPHYWISLSLVLPVSAQSLPFFGQTIF